MDKQHFHKEISLQIIGLIVRMLKIVTLTMMSFMHSSWKTALFNIPPLFRRTKAPLAGLDISMRGIRLVELRAPDKHLLQLQCCSCETLPQGAIANDEIEDLDLVRTAVQRLWAQSGSGSRRVAIGIPAATAVTALLPLGATVQLDDEDQLTALANAHIASLLPYPIEQACVDFCVQAPLRDKLGHQLLIGAARRDIIEDRLAIAEALDLHVAVVEIDSCAEYAAWTRTLAPAADPSSATEHVTGLLRIDSGGIQLSMFVSARQTNEPLQYHHHRRASEQRNDTPLELARAVVQMWFHGLAVAQRATTRSPDAPTQHSIVLTGTHARAAELLAALRQLTQANVSVSIAAPFAGMALGPGIDSRALRAEGPSYLAACGLALRRCDS